MRKLFTLQKVLDVLTLVEIWFLSLWFTNTKPQAGRLFPVAPGTRSISRVHQPEPLDPLNKLNFSLCPTGSYLSQVVCWSP